MYGYISLYFKPNEEERNTYLYYYCGLCNSLKENFGEIHRLTIIKEVVFFSILNNPFEHPQDTRCPYVGFKKRIKPLNNSFMKPYSYLNLLIIYGKLLDYKLEKNNVPKHILKKFERKLGNYFNSDFIDAYQNLIQLQQEIENYKLDIDDYAKPSEKIMELLFKRFFKQEYPETMPIVTAYLIYLMDSIYDFKKDIKRGKFNAISTSFNTKKIENLKNEQKERLLFTYDLCAKELIENVESISLYNKHLAKKLATFSLIYHRNQMNKILIGGQKHGKPENYSRKNKKGRIQKPIFKI